MKRFLILFIIPIALVLLSIQHAVLTENYEDQEGIITAIYSAAFLLSIHISINSNKISNENS